MKTPFKLIIPFFLLLVTHVYSQSSIEEIEDFEDFSQNLIVPDGWYSTNNTSTSDYTWGIVKQISTFCTDEFYPEPSVHGGNNFIYTSGNFYSYDNPQIPNKALCGVNTYTGEYYLNSPRYNVDSKYNNQQSVLFHFDLNIRDIDSDDVLKVILHLDNGSSISLFETSSTTNGWENSGQVEIGNYVDGQIFQLEFRFTRSNSGNHEGVFLDNVTLNRLPEKTITFSDNNYLSGKSFINGTSISLNWESNFSDPIDISLKRNNGTEFGKTYYQETNDGLHDFIIPSNLISANDWFIEFSDGSSTWRTAEFSMIEAECHLSGPSGVLTVGDKPEDSTYPIPISISNNGNTTTSYSAYRTSGSSRFSISPTSFVLDPGEVQPCIISFSPSSISSYSANFAVSSNCGESITFGVEGNGVAIPNSGILLQQEQDDFGEVIIGGSKRMDFLIRNYESYPININISVSSGFTNQDQSSYSLAAYGQSGSFKIFEVKLAPQYKGPIYGSVQASGGGFSQSVDLIGIGIEKVASPSVSISNNNLISGSYYSGSVSVTLNNNHSGATVRYTTDGSEPNSSSSLYSSPFTVSSSRTIKAKAFKSGSYIENSNTVSKSITITGAVAKPSPNLFPGKYYDDINVKLSNYTSDLQVYYTIDGSTPSITSATYNHVNGIEITQNTTLKLIATKSNWLDSDVYSGYYEIEKILSVPSANPSPLDTTFIEPVSVSLFSFQGADLYYTTDGSEPTLSSQLFSQDFTIAVSTTVKVMAVKQDWENSEVASFNYRFGEESASLSVSPKNQDVNSSSGSTTFNVTTNLNTYIVTDDKLWMSVSKSGNTITASYDSNSNSSSRTATITISGSGVDDQYVTVTQLEKSIVDEVIPTIIFINEIHYDNSGTDVNEKIELVAPIGTDLSGWKVYLYNGSDGLVYSEKVIETGVSLINETNGFGFLEIDVDGIQNGAPDGIALVDNENNVVQFISYEGVFEATDGPAHGLSSTDIGVSESSITNQNASLQLSGTGSEYSDFAWEQQSMATFSSVNQNQNFTKSNNDQRVCTTTFSEDFSGDLSKWTNPTGQGSWTVSDGTLRGDYGIGCGSRSCPQADLILKSEYQLADNWKATQTFTRYTAYSGTEGSIAKFSVFVDSSSKFSLSIGEGSQYINETSLDSVIVGFQHWSGSWGDGLNLSPKQSKNRRVKLATAWNPNDVNSASLKRVGTTYSLYFNDEFLFSFEDVYLNGQGGVGFHTYGGFESKSFMLESCTETKEEMVINECESMKMTAQTYSETDDLNQKIIDEYGDSFSIVDWNELTSKTNIHEWISCMDFKDDQTFMVTKDGSFFYGSNRQYYVQYSPDGVPYSGFLVHDQIDNSLFLGSWYGLNINVMTTEIDQPTATAELTDEFLDFEDNQVPSGWVFSVIRNADISNGRLNAYTTDGHSRLSKAVKVSTETDQIIFEWDGFVAESFWGMGTPFSIFKGTERISFSNHTEDYNYAIDDLHLQITYYEGSTSKIITEKNVKFTEGEYHFKIIADSSGYRFITHEISTGELVNSLTLSDPQNYFYYSEIDSILIEPFANTGNNSWADNFRISINSTFTVKECDSMKMTAQTYSETDDLNQKIIDEYGESYSIADWNELTSKSNIHEWIACMDFNEDQTFMVTKDGEYFYGSNRQYYVQYSPDGVPYSGFLVHEQIDESLFLGSWYGLNMNVLIKESSLNEKNCTTTFSEDFSGDLSKWTNPTGQGSWTINGGILHGNYNISCGSVGCPQADLILKEEYQLKDNWKATQSFTKFNYYSNTDDARARFGVFVDTNNKLSISIGEGSTYINQSSLDSVQIGFGRWDGTWKDQSVLLSPKQSKTGRVKLARAWNSNDVNSASLKRVGTTYSLYFNDEFLFSFEDVYLNGQGGVGFHTYGGFESKSFVLENCTETTEELVINECEDFKMTTQTYSETDDLNQKIADEYGDSYSIADWSVLKSKPNIHAWISCMDFKDDQTFMVTKDGSFFYGSNRQYYIQYSPDGVPYSGFLVHDEIGGTLFLGSWYGLNMNILSWKSDNQNEPPSISAVTFTIPENSVAGTVVGTVTASDPENDDLVFSILSGNELGAFEIDANLGAITIADENTLDYETNPTFELSVEVSDGELSNRATISVNLTNENESPSVAGNSFSLDENSAAGTAIGTVSASDPENDDLIYSIISGNQLGAFRISANSGTITVADAAPLDFETNPTFQLVIRVSDGELSDEATISIQLNDLIENMAPVMSDQLFTIDENSAAGTFVGLIQASDPDGNSITYSIVGNSEVFALNVTTGVLIVSAGDQLDFERNSSFSLTIEISDGQLKSQGIVIVNLEDINESPSINPASFIIEENSTISFMVGSISAADPENDQLTFNITSGNESGAFVINQSTGDLLVANASPINYEVNTAFSLTIEVSDGALVAQATFPIEVTDINEAPTAIDLSASEINERESAGVLIGTLSAVDEDSGESFTYSVDNSSSDFAISNDELLSNVEFDFADGATREVVITVEDKGGLTYSETFEITIIKMDILEADEELRRLKVYPNPVSDFIQIDADKLEEVKIFDLTGKQLMITNKHRIDVRSLPEGTYLLYVQSDGQLRKLKIIKE